MGQAKARGTFEQRKDAAITRDAQQGVEAMIDSIDAGDAIIQNRIKRGPSKSLLMESLLEQSMGVVS